MNFFVRMNKIRNDVTGRYGGVMFRIGFCDNDSSVLEELTNWIEDYRKKGNQNIEYVLFNSPLEVLTYLEEGGFLEVLFSETDMLGMNGIKMAREIKLLDNHMKLIFLTNTAEYAVESYQVNAYFYQLKPIHLEKLDELMDRILLERRIEEEDFFVLKCRTGITRIYFYQLEYGEIINRKLYLYLNNGMVLESGMSMEDLEGKLEHTGKFIRPHRSYIVNMEYIVHLGKDNILMKDRVEISIPRIKRKEIKEKYLDYLQRNNW